VLIRDKSVVAVVLLLCGCNTVAGLGTDLGLTDDAVTPAAAADKPGGQALPIPTFAQGQVVMVVKPAILRDRPSLDGTVIGYGNLGDTYVVFGQEKDWVQIGSDRPLAWVFDTLIAEGPATAAP
jgi:predicted small secreted protein